MSKPTVAVDFDGVIHRCDGWTDPGDFGEPVDGAAKFLERLAKRHRIVVVTTRVPTFVLRWLDEQDLGYLVERVTCEKPLATAHVDDRAVRFRGDFEAVLEQIREPPWWQK